MAKKKDNVVNLYSSDPRLCRLYDAMLDTITEKGDGIPFLAVLGMLEYMKLVLYQKQNEAMEERV